MVRTDDEGLMALREGRAFVDLSDRRKVRVGGADAVAWLHDLLTADIASLEVGRATRSLLLSPTGRIRADLHVIRRSDDLLLIQAPDQPDHVGLLLGPYILSSKVELDDATTEVALFAVPGDGARLVGHPASEPSTLGQGVDVCVGTGKPAWRVEDAFIKAGLTEATHGAMESWRIERGTPRMGPDFGQDSLPSEAGLEAAIDFSKGCFLGQESVAKVRNLGHPPWIVRAFGVEGPAATGDAILWGSGEVGYVTSAVDRGDTTVGLAKIRWEASGQPLTLPDGRPLDLGTPG